MLDKITWLLNQFQTIDTIQFIKIIWLILLWISVFWITLTFLKQRKRKEDEIFNDDKKLYDYVEKNYHELTSEEIVKLIYEINLIKDYSNNNEKIINNFWEIEKFLMISNRILTNVDYEDKTFNKKDLIFLEELKKIQFLYFKLLKPKVNFLFWDDIIEMFKQYNENATKLYYSKIVK